MGQVQIPVKLTNAIDEGIARRGQLEASKIRHCEVQALVDTGAISCVLPKSLVESLGLARAFDYDVQYADGRQEQVDVTEPVLMEILGRKVYEECLVLGEIVLIGQTALEMTDLLVDCRGGQVIPNPAHPNKPVITIL
jgi:clan AA aspartic protease